MPPWILGCSVLTRPPSISGAPVISETETTSIPASESAFAVPPVEMIANPTECGQERRMNVQNGGEALEEDRRQDPHVSGTNHQPDAMDFDPARKLHVIVFLADEPGGVDVLDRDAGPPRPLESERLLLVPRYNDKVLGKGVEQSLQIRPGTRRQHGEARALGQPLRQTLLPRTL